MPGGIGKGGAGDAFGASGMGPVVAGSGSHGTKDADPVFGADTEPHAVMSTKTAAASHLLTKVDTRPEQISLPNPECLGSEDGPLGR